MAGRPKVAMSEKKQRLTVFVKGEHLPLVIAYVEKLNKGIIDVPDKKTEVGVIQKSSREPTEPIIEKPKLGKDTLEFLAEKGISPELGYINIIEPEKKQEIDYTEWRSDPTMIELDRAILYEVDGYGYPDIANDISARYPSIWVKAHQAKDKKLIDAYNEIMTELWEKIK